jgi:thiamine biosynthesis lipoprotein
LGTFVEVSICGSQPEEVLHDYVTRAFEIIRSVQTVLSFHDPESDLSRLNRGAHNHPLRIHPWLYHVLAESVALSRATDGAFDVTVAPRLVKSDLLPHHLPIEVLNADAQWKDIELLEDSRIGFRQPLAVDLGGIAKGFAVDKAIEHLGNLDISGAIVNAGGDLRVFGYIDSKVAIRDPSNPYRDALPTLMHRPALATSASYFVCGQYGSSRIPAIQHPRTGKPMRRSVSVSIFAKSCMEADALTKAVLLAPQALWQQLLAERDAVVLTLSKQGEQWFFPA